MIGIMHVYSYQILFIFICSHYIVTSKVVAQYHSRIITFAQQDHPPLISISKVNACKQAMFVFTGKASSATDSCLAIPPSSIKICVQIQNRIKRHCLLKSSHSGIVNWHTGTYYGNFVFLQLFSRNGCISNIDFNDFCILTLF